MAQKDLKEAFISNLNGTSLGEVVLGSLLAPVCIIIRGLIWVLRRRAGGPLVFPFPLLSHLLLDVCALVFPLVLSCTVLSDVLHQVILGLAFFSFCLLFFVISRSSERRSQKSVGSFLQTPVQCQQVPFVTLFRVFVNVKTAISILAVDFAVFPRRYAKTETYGTGVMDFGVGAFIFANALVCPEARRKDVPGSKVRHVARQILSAWPLLVLGLGRLASVKLSGYQEHVTEYGVHWNFFFTLAMVRVLTSALLTVLPSSLLWASAALTAGSYQFALETTELKAFMLHNDDRERDFLHANKEGVFTVSSYVAIYLAGVQFGQYVMQPRARVKDWLRMLVNLLLGSLLLYGLLHLCQALVEPVSRRLANLPFVVWTVAQSLLFMSCLGLADMVLLFAKTRAGSPFVPSSLNLPEKDKGRRVGDRLERFCLIRAVNRNQLLFFLLANVLTGAVNTLVDTLNCSGSLSLTILLLYMFVNCAVIYSLHVFGITVKFW